MLLMLMKLCSEATIKLRSVASSLQAYFFCLLGVFNLVQPLLFCHRFGLQCWIAAPCREGPADTIVKGQYTPYIVS